MQPWPAEAVRGYCDLAMSRKITALSVQKRNPQRVNVELDGEFAFGLARIVAAWLQVGQDLSEEKIAQLQSEDGREVTYQQALRFLSYRPRAEAEIRKNLQGHGSSEEEIRAALERLRRSGLVEDTRFAQQWVDNRSEMRPRSRRALAYELHQRGVDRQVIEETVAGLDDEQLAYQAGSRQARRWCNLEWSEFRQKMYAYLSRRGFGFESTSPAVARIWAELQADTLRDEEDNV